MFNSNQIYNNLMKLCDANEAFFYSDQQLEDRTYRLFNYRIASFTEFLLPDAMECRGIMYDITEEPKLASLPMRKFWNLLENPLTMDIDLTNPIRIMDKSDGSLISTYIHNNELRLKTKGSLVSDQAIAAMKWVGQPIHIFLYEYLYTKSCNGYTCNLEWIGPDNRIVLSYPESKLVLLNVRSHETGEYVDIYDSTNMLYKQYGVELFSPNDPKKFIENIPNMQEKIEGFVIEYAPNKFVKVKTDAYKALHRSKDNINTPRRLFEVVLDEVSDDLKTLFFDDPVSLQIITDMEQFVETAYNHLVYTVEKFYKTNMQMQRKDYAILGQMELKHIPNAFPLAMNKYVGKPVNYKELMKRKWKTYGLQEKVSLDE